LINEKFESVFFCGSWGFGFSGDGEAKPKSSKSSKNYWSTCLGGLKNG